VDNKYHCLDKKEYQNQVEDKEYHRQQIEMDNDSPNIDKTRNNTISSIGDLSVSEMSDKTTKNLYFQIPDNKTNKKFTDLSNLEPTEKDNLAKIRLHIQKKNEKLNFKEFIDNMKSEYSQNNTIEQYKMLNNTINNSSNTENKNNEINLTSVAQKQSEDKKAHISVK
jgi:hypothetical protein